MTFGERIVYFREKRGLSQKALAELIGITANRLYYYEKDKRQPDVALIKAIAKALAITGDDLLGTEWANEKAPETEVSEAQEKSSIVSALTNMLQSVGWIGEDGDISDEDWRFLRSVAAMLDSYFEEQR